MNAAAAFCLYYAPFPQTLTGIVRGMVSRSKETGRFLIVIDSNLPPAEQENTLKHELAHILLNHLETAGNIREQEAEADRKAAEMTADELQSLLSRKFTEKHLPEWKGGVC